MGTPVFASWLNLAGHHFGIDMKLIAGYGDGNDPSALACFVLRSATAQGWTTSLWSMTLATTLDELAAKLGYDRDGEMPGLAPETAVELVYQTNRRPHIERDAEKDPVTLLPGDLGRATGTLRAGRVFPSREVTGDEDGCIRRPTLLAITANDFFGLVILTPIENSKGRRVVIEGAIAAPTKIGESDPVFSMLADVPTWMPPPLDVDQMRADRQGVVFSIGATKAGLVLLPLGPSEDEPFEPSNYPPRVLEAHGAIIAELAKDKPRARMAIYMGPTGTGKTHLVQNLIGSVPATWIVVQADMIHILARPDLLPFLQEQSFGRMVFVVEDADEALVQRDEDKGLVAKGAMSTLLNFTDGVIGKRLDVRVVATTNIVEKENVDDALRRARRTIRRVDVAPLEVAHANEVLVRLGCAKTVTTPTALATLYEMATR